MKKWTLISLTAAIALPLQAAQPVMKAPATSPQATNPQTAIQCPEELDWPFQTINVNDCNLPGFNVQPICQKWNNGQASVPSGWQYHSSGAYSPASHMVYDHRISKINNKDFLICNYAMNRSYPVYMTYTIRKEAPGNMICSKADNYSFTCTAKSMKRYQPIQR
ncbi:MAG: hypothetical protein R3312_06820 [Gammaproteobacteria bacterium]|nr:hypothetical protein [Gammaproteobacteria bacterium]